ncbi:MAG: gluconate 2-dehydrogenase subunit 3 family protein [Myxococcota bacterium]|nr:gluconate 2-dehydrogenase subunit 3 family protein [Myxococcota bacterium]
MALSRRSILGLGLGGTIALTLGGLALFPGRGVTPQSPLQSFTPAQYATLCALAEVVCPASDALPSALEVGVPAQLDALFATLPPENGQEIGLALGLLENALVGALLDARPRPFSRLPIERRVEIWAAWSRSNIPLRRTVYKGLNSLISATAYGNPAYQRHAGYPGPPVPA